MCFKLQGWTIAHPWHSARGPPGCRGPSLGTTALGRRYHRYITLAAEPRRRGVKLRDIMHYKQCTLSLTNLPHFIMPWNSDEISVHFCSPIAGFFFSFLKNCFRNFPGAKINFVTKGIQVRFEMAVKQVYKQTERQTDIFVIIIEEFKTRSLNFYLASDKL